MNKKEWKQTLFVLGIILLATLVKDLTVSKTVKGGILYREEAGGDEQEIDLIAEIEGMEDEYSYHLVIDAVDFTKDEAESYISQAKQMIETDFLEMSSKLPIAETYVSDAVEAKWVFSPAEYVKKDGSIIFHNIPSEGALINVTTLLTCGKYEEIYTFPIWVDDSMISVEEKYGLELEKEIDALTESRDTKAVELPSLINGKTIKWSVRKESLFLKILFFELVAVALVLVSARQRQKQESDRRKTELELTYANVVNQLAILLRAGMTTRQAWNRIATQEGKKKQIQNTPISEHIYRLNMRLKEGEKERAAYEMFAKEVDVVCYRRLMRILIANLEKGTSDICSYLEEESRKAYEERILLAKKRGEEASTKMLLPLMIMMVLVMAIVLIPAIISFST